MNAFNPDRDFEHLSTMLQQVTSAGPRGHHRSALQDGSVQPRAGAAPGGMGERHE